jgi:Response regulator containing a CheY-like receiver domain and a GGDEF domain
MTNDAMQARLDAIWEQSRDAIAARVDAIENAAMALLEGTLDGATRQHAKSEAHKLAGVAGTFGFAASTDHAREAEGLLEGEESLSSADIMRLSTIAVALRHELIEIGRTARALVEKQAAPAKEIRVGMIDDDPGMLALVEALVSDAGVRVQGMSEPEQLWRMLETNPPDVLILDVDMPQISGIELCRSIRANPRWDIVPVVFLTARTGASVELFGAGADNYLTKPVDGPELIAVIQRAARRQRTVATAAASGEWPTEHGEKAPRAFDADVVLVDDDEILTELLRHSLVARGYSVRILTDGSAALDQLTGATPKLHARVIILDVGLPEHDGLAVLRALARDGITRRTRVIMLTARSLESEVVQALDLGAHDHVGKPFSVAVLMHRVVKALDGSPAAE